MDDSSTVDGSLANFSTTNSGEELSIKSVASKVAPAGTHLLLLAPRGGIVVIAISSGSIVQLTARNQYLSLWTVQLDEVEDGDCGSWIVDRVTGELFGMLMATCEALSEAYVLPVKDVFTEIETLSGHSVKLPASESTIRKKEPIILSLEESEPVEESKSIEQKPMYLPKLPARKPKLMKDSTFASLGDSNLHYPRLQAGEIRIVTLLPGHFGATVQCKISVRSMNASADYEGLSYVWNRPKQMKSINVNGQSIQVDSNLASALEDLRYIDRARSLWVESLCINQEDIDERNNHVSLLAPIMTRARSVCIWLGKRDVEIRSLFSDDSISHIIKLDDFNRNRAMSRKVANAFSRLAKEARFHLGFVQAICLARCPILYCGRHSMPWRDFADMILILEQRHPSTSAPSGRLYHSYGSSDDEGDPDIDISPLPALVEYVDGLVRWQDDGQIQRIYSLESLVMRFSWIKPTVDHDAIYSMLPLANDVSFSAKPSVPLISKTLPPLQAVSQLEVIPPVFKALQAFRRPVKRRPLVIRNLIVDYSQPFEYLCKDFVQVAIHNSQSLDILCRPWAPPSVNAPSWVADWSQAPVVMDRDNLFRRFNGDYFTSDCGHRKIKTYDASRLKRPIFRLSDSPTGAPRISVEGFILDAIHLEKPPALMGNIPPGWVYFLGWKNIEDPPPEKAWRSLVGDCGMGSIPPPGYYQRACEKVFRRVGPGSSLNIQQEILRSGPMTQEFLQRVEAVVWGRRLIKTEKHGFVGLAPGATKKRDVVAILYGLSVPVVLRQVQDSSEGDSVFTMVGECFIYGMMNGEALDLQEAQGIRDQTFMLL